MRNPVGWGAAIGLALALCAGEASGAAADRGPAAGRHAMVATDQHVATEVGRRILEAGGNAIDAAVAVGYALAVVDPCCGNLGGGGFMTIHLADGRDRFVNFREKAPLAATRDMMLDAAGNPVPERSRRGWLAVAVPGTVLGLDTALRDFGTMSRAQVMAPAIALAADGFVLTAGDVDILRPHTAQFAASPNVAAIFLKDGQAYQAGDRLVQPELAATLRLIARDGPDAFYRGPIAAAIAADSAAHGGNLTKADFAGYTVELRPPVTCRYRGYRIVSSAPPSSGGTTLCEILGILQGFPMGALGFHSAAAVHDMVEAMRWAYVDRNTQIGDPDFVKVPLDRLLSEAHLDALRAHIEPGRATPSGTIASPPAPEGAETTHYSIVDAKGNAVAVTYTINGYFGTGLIAGHTGFFLNNSMDDFSSKPGAVNMFGLVQGAADSIAPGKRPLSSMAPTIVTRNGKVFLVAGSPGGSRIITIVLETLINVIDYHMPLQAAVDAPRLHHQWLPDVVEYEPGAVTDRVMARLEAMGYRLVERPHWGAVEAVEVDPRTGRLAGANDFRRPAGAALGY